MKFDFVVPTYNRFEKLARLLRSLRLQLSENIRIWVYCDNNDVETKNRVMESFSDIVHLVAVVPERRMFFGNLNEHLKHCKADAMFYVCDDVEFLDGSLLSACQCFEKYLPDTDGVLGLNQVNIPNGSDSAMGIIGMRFADRFPQRQCFCPDYISFHADAELGKYAKSIGKFVFCEEAKIVHYHPAIVKEEKDNTHGIVRQFKQRDAEVRNLRKLRNLLWGRDFKLVSK